MSIEWDIEIIRDPLYGYIGLTKGEASLLDTAPLQRLRRIKQLAHTDLVYPGATHSRLEHSLGCLYLADRIAQKLKFSDGERLIVRSAALLHDVGHGPFSHVFENVLALANDREIEHSSITSAIIKSREISKLLGSLSKPILEIFAKKETESALRELISSSLDVDKLDYLRRDSYYTGVAYGIFDVERIMHTLDLVEKRHIAVQEKGKDALISFKLARYLMHIQVYQHHVRLIADSMITRAAKLSFRNNTLKQSDFQVSGNTDKFLKKFLSLDDNRFLSTICDGGGKAAKLIYMLRDRRLLKRGFQKDMRAFEELTLRKIKKMNRIDFERMEREIAKEVKVDKDYLVVYPLRVENPVYRDPDRYLKKDLPILIKLRDGTVKSFEDISPVTGAPEKYVEQLFVFCLPEHVEKVRGATKKYLDDLR